MKMTRAKLIDVRSLPDHIELFRIIRAGGRSDRDKAKAVEAHLLYLAEVHPSTSPCNGVCTLVKGRCVGCGRTIEEIREQGL